MEDNFNYDDFEEFLQDQVRNHRMYPADSVWREIDKKLHGEKRWPALTIAAAMLVGATVLICVYFTPKPNIFSVPTATANIATQQSSQKNNILNSLNPSAPFNREKSFTGLAKNNGVEVTQEVPENRVKKPGAVKTVPNIASTKTSTASQIQTKISVTSKSAIPATQRFTERVRENEVFGTVNDEIVKAAAPSVAINNVDSKINRAATTGTTPTVKDYTDKNMVDEFLQDHQGDIPLHTTSKKVSLKNRFSYQLYVAPSVSYRKLLEDNSILNDNSGGPVGLNYVTDVNKVVRHRPGTGIEAGVSIMYNLSNKVRVKSGFQFNMRQYSIEAYRSSTELASIALRGNNGFDTVNTLAIYRNNNGYYSTQLVNRYYQISVPLGIEWEIIGNKLFALNVAGSIQPTYLLNRNAYLLSTNFKNYTESPGMIRQWNINSNIEAFVSMKVGDFRWQLGPQLRYQPYSTFIPEYTIKEHLMDYGLKLGVSKTLP